MASCLCPGMAFGCGRKLGDTPLVALMADQGIGLEARNITCCAAISGLLSMPERSDILDRVRLGDIGILIVSPEQLRDRTVRRAIGQREIGAWVFDEAHCISKMGPGFPARLSVCRALHRRCIGPAGFLEEGNR